MTLYTINHYFIHGIVVIKLEGGCGEECAKEIEALIDQLLKKEYIRYILDVTNLSFVETPGFRLLVQKASQIHELEGSLTVVGLSGRVERAFKLLKLGSVVNVANDVESAIAELIESDESEGTYEASLV